MKVLVTGGCGFLGSHVCEFYRNLGWEVVSYDNMTKYELKKTGYDEELARAHNWDFLETIGVELIKEDVRDFTTLREAVAGCDYIVHTAAQPAMTLSMQDPVLDFTTNVAGTFNVLMTARELGVPVVTCATIHVYGTDINEGLVEAETRYVRTPAEIAEDQPTMTGTISPLHASKMSGEHYVRAFIDTYGLTAASFRLTGLYGPRQFGGEDHGWVANFTIRALQQTPITLFGTGRQVRDILYAADACKAIHAFYEKRVAGIYNIGGGSESALSLLECLGILEEMTGREVERTFGGDRFGDLYYFVCDTRKAQRLLGWKAEVRPATGIRHLADWVQQNMHVFDGTRAAVTAS